ncbi:unnamed protein product [Peronospora destructor]|uniref:EF-hand domain-containing protein n=1 Tax=Peronospora destructor TaxID=86335 RepID=A0AAV0UII1_9STRA|nr:unnamed protein product [Peronospora destructor]
MLRLASRRQRVLVKWRQSNCFSQKYGISTFQTCTNTVKSSVAKTFLSQPRSFEISHTHQIWYQAANDNVRIYWKSVALAAGIGGALGLLNEPKPVACATNKGGDEDFIEQAKKMVQELSNIAMAQFTSLFPENYSYLHKKVDECLASGKGGQISLGFCMGMCAGFALKKVSKLGAVILGKLFIILQCASYSGYVNVNYKRFKREFKGYVDIDKDGVLDTKDLDSMYKLIMEVLEFSLPASSGLAAGFILGFRLG